MSFVYVTDHKSQVGVEKGRIIVKNSDGLIRSIPIENTESITIMGNAQVSTNCIGECLKKGISIQYYSSNGSYFGKLSSTQHVNTNRQRKQMKLTENKIFSLKLAKIILESKINNQMVLLRRYHRNSNTEVNTQIELVKALKNKVNSAKSIQESSGYEGSAAKAYFKGLNLLINIQEFKFNGRSRQPPKDAFNSMISLGYSILMNEVYGAIEARGLNPYFGFIHQDKEKHPTLASDMMEEWRATIVDSVVMSLINGHEIEIDNFLKCDNSEGIFLNKDGMKIILNKLENRFNTSTKYLNYIEFPVSFRRAIDMQALQLSKAIEEENPEIYQPVIIR